MKLISSAIAVVFAALLTGCGEPEPEPAPPPVELITQKKLPNERVLADFYRASGIRDPLPAKSDALITDTSAQRLKASAMDLKNAAERAEDPQAVIDTAANEIAAKIQEADAKTLYTYVGPLVEAYGVLRPGDAQYQPVAANALRQLTRPRVALRGLYHDHTSGMSTAALKIYDPKTRKTTTENVRMGEDIYNMTFLEIIGKDEGVVLLFGDQRIEILKGDDPK